MSLVKTGAGVALGVVSVLLALWLLYLIRPVLVLLLASVLFAQAISPLVLALRRLGARRAQAVLVIYLVIVAALTALGWSLWQIVSGQVETLLDSLPEMQRQLKELLSGVPLPTLRDTLIALLASPTQTVQPEQAVPGLFNTVRTLLEGIFAVFSLFVVTFYWISERLAIRRWLLMLLPAQHRDRGLTVWEDVEEKLGAWVRGELVVMLCIGAAFAAGLGLMGVHFWLVLALFAALAEIVPIAGPYVGTLPAVVVALTQSPHLALMVTLYGVAVQLLENWVLTPRIMGRTTGVSPLTVIVGILVGATLMGISGALLAVPIAAAIQVLLNDLEILNSRDKEVIPQSTLREPVDAR